MSVTFTMRMDAEDKRLIADFAKMQNKSMSEFMLQAAMEAIEDEVDLAAWREAKREFDDDPQACTLTELKESLELA